MSPSSMSRPKRLSFQTRTQFKFGFGSRARATISWRPGLDLACDWAVDDAGAGYASLRHIIELRPRYVKLDRGLVTGINADPIRQALVAGMLHFASSIGLEIIAEGVETEAERLTLKALGVALGQGFLFGRPAPAGG